uniref:Acetyl coenzyme A synthetase (ADP forming), alpha domain protein n=1 Tax=uncultured Chloroflexota bacterium TaxID=166587 RepID=H5SDX2_9CHLR|nr:acetyl coenzyme A synthetase (ADP forming), alpha domain protein [uncultured Chloroflexota bacterium]
MSIAPGLLSLLSPRSIVLIGASTHPEKLGYGIARNLVQSGYPGRIYFLSQRSGELFGHPLYRHLAELPETPDLAILSLAAEQTPAALNACAEKGIPAAIIVSSGFRESGQDGAALERACLEIAHAAGMRLLGPNCIGILDTHLPLDTTFLQPPMPLKGKIAFLSQSGAFCAALMDWARQQGIGFSRVISLGNQADLKESDFLPLLSQQPENKVIVLYLESLKDGERFLLAAREASRRLPLLVLKAGRSPGGQKAAASHTGALATDDALFDAAFEWAGILRVADGEQLIRCAHAFEALPPLAGRRIAILTNAGGPAVLAADALERHGLQLATFQPQTLQALQALLPPAAALHNPVDMLASASPQTYAQALAVLLADPGVDGLLVIIPPPPMYPAEAVSEALLPLIQPMPKPLGIVLMGGDQVAEARRRFLQTGIPVYSFPEQAAEVLGMLARRQEHITRPELPAMAHSLADPELIAALEAAPSGWVEAGLLARLLESLQIPTLPLRLARHAAEVREQARQIGFPLVMKIASPHILHKSELGGVVLNIQSEEMAVQAFEQMMARVRAQMPQAVLEGVFLQRQVSGGREVILGGLRQASLGPFVLFGSGGVEVEARRDIAFAYAPLSLDQAEALLRRTWAGRSLWGFRDQPPLDHRAVLRALVNLSSFLAEFRRVAEFEINPLYVLPQGMYALDARLRLE